MSFFTFFNRALDVVLPPRPTQKIVRQLTQAELRALTLRGEKSGSLPYHEARVRALVWELKYYASVEAAELAGAILSDVLIGIRSESLGTPLLIPIPMHGARRRERGHNQTEVLCAAALRSLGEVRRHMFDYAPYIVERVYATPQQQGLAKHEREQNLRGSMQVRGKDTVRGRSCVVVDDVSTTGATFAEARRALYAAGAAHVECVALAYS